MQAFLFVIYLFGYTFTSQIDRSERVFAIDCMRRLEKLVDFDSDCIDVRRSRFCDSFNNDTFNIVLAAVIMCLIGGMQASIGERVSAIDCMRRLEKLVDFDSDCIGVRRSRFCYTFISQIDRSERVFAVDCKRRLKKLVNFDAVCIGVRRSRFCDSFNNDTFNIVLAAVIMCLIGGMQAFCSCYTFTSQIDRSERVFAVDCKRRLEKLVNFDSDCIGVRRSRFCDSFNNDTFNIVLAAVIMCLIGGYTFTSQIDRSERVFAVDCERRLENLVNFDSDCIGVRRSRFCDSFNNDTFNIVLAAVIMCLIGGHNFTSQIDRSEQIFAVDCKRRLEKLVNFDSDCIGVRRSRFCDSFNNDTFNIVLAAVIMCLIGGYTFTSQIDRSERVFAVDCERRLENLVNFDSDCIGVRRSRFCDSFNKDTFNIVLAAVIMCLIGGYTFTSQIDRSERVFAVDCERRLENLVNFDSDCVGVRRSRFCDSFNNDTFNIVLAAVIMCLIDNVQAFCSWRFVLGYTFTSQINRSKRVCAINCKRKLEKLVNFDSDCVGVRRSRFCDSFNKDTFNIVLAAVIMCLIDNMQAFCSCYAV
ncbi:hypothetical protein KSF78_0009631 [Schistosoma japonicum]|nr:hypothetical protein KSF78_0009631 [Schistosoma japonicum]